MASDNLTKKTDTIARELKSMRWKFRINAWLTVIIGGLILILLIAYFSIGYREIASFRDPELIISPVFQVIDDQIPVQRRQIEEQINANAPTWAKQGSEQVLKAIPPLREKIEEVAIQQADKAIAKMDTLGEEKFREVLEQNRQAVKDAIARMDENEGMPEAVLTILQEAIEKELQIDSENQAAAVLAVVTDLNANMTKLQAGEGLSEEQQIEREVLMLARRLYLKHFGDMKLEDLEIAPLKEAAERAVDAELKTEKEEPDNKPIELPAKEDEAKPEEKEEARKEEETPAAKPEEEAAAPAEEEKADPPKPEEEAEEAKPEEAKEEEAPKEEETPAPAEEEKAEEPKPEEKEEEAKPEEAEEEAPEEEEKPADEPAEEEEEEKEAAE